MASNYSALPIYTTSGNLGALMKYPYLFNPQGEWIGWVTPEGEVYSVHGDYVGWVSRDPRILRTRVSSPSGRPKRTPPRLPPTLKPPSSFPLPPMMPELLYSVVDVLDDTPDLLPTVDSGELRDDMD
jgi:hypothetical protein